MTRDPGPSQPASEALTRRAGPATRRDAKSNPTAAQRRVLSAIHHAETVNGLPPTIRELTTALGLASTNTVAGHVLALRKAGLVTREPGLARTLRLTAEGYAALEGDRVNGRPGRMIGEVLGPVLEEMAGRVRG